MAQIIPLANAKTMAADGVAPNGLTQGFCKLVENGSLIQEPKTEMEGFIMREHDIDVIREPVAEINPNVREAPDDCRNVQPLLSSNQGACGVANGNFFLQKRRVQWVDNFGKELVQVLEYEASDTGDSEVEDDDADAHACACTIQ